MLIEIPCLFNNTADPLMLYVVYLILAYPSSLMSIEDKYSKYDSSC